MAKMSISSPQSVTKVTGYQAVPGAAIPPLNIWLKDTGTWPRDNILKLLDESVGAYYTCLKHWDKLAVLGRLYFLTNGWLDFAKANKNPATTAREPVVNNLFLAVVDRLCFRFDCAVNVLPQKLEDCWGRVLTPHGHEIDTKHAATGALPVIADYLDRAEVEKYRLIFVNGLASQRTWWKNPPDDARTELAESSRVGWEYGRADLDPMMGPDYAGFAMSMSRQIFMAHHRGCFRKHNFFHSSYLSGDSVLCTGTMLIRKGRVLAIKNDSGHYQPTLEHLLNVVEALQMYGFSPVNITVTAVKGSWKYDNGAPGDYEIESDGQELLNWRGSGATLQNRTKANQANIKARGGLQLTRIIPKMP
jgi:hypothetical protein